MPILMMTTLLIWKIKLAIFLVFGFSALSLNFFEHTYVTKNNFFVTPKIKKVNNQRDCQKQ